ncbi:amidohydrolase [Novosphingobium bradum]|uniref:Amidohydrolase n=1 Tax=Novosphingobium bradum TaxID=1737444 RepID=A0ABV7INU9_9SPHN
MLPAALLATTARADTLVDHVDGFTLDSAGRVERLTGLLIGNDGRIAQVLRQGDKRPARVDYLLDGQGRVLMPGLVDAHAHVMRIGFAALTLDLSPARTLAEAQGRIAVYAAAHPDRAWVLGRGWDPAVLGQPTAAALDQVVKDRPVWLESADAHQGWANSAALAAAGITATTKDPAGGRILRAPGPGKAPPRPTGLLIEAAMDMVARAAPAPRPEDRDLALAAAQDALLAQGITAVTDMGTGIEDWQAYRRAGDLGALRVRVLAYAAGTDAMSLIAGPGPTPWLYDDRLRLGGVALVADGALATRGAWLKAPYADAPTPTGATQVGLPRSSETQLRNLMSRAGIDRFQVALEAHGAQAVAAGITAFAELAQTYKGDRRWRIDGAEVVDPADLAKLGSSGIVVAVQPGALAPALAAARLGEARLASVQPWASLARAGVPLAFGSGASGADRLAPWANLAIATTRQDAAGQPFGGWQPQERLTREAALAAATAGAAWAAFAEGRFGRLEVGQRADFLLLDRDPLLASPGELRETKVLETWVGGRKAWAAASSPPASGGR